MRLYGFPEIRLGQEMRSGDVRLTFYPEPASRLRFLRVYERLHADRVEAPNSAKTPTSIERDTWEVIKDALIDQRYDAAQELVTDVLGPWRPSTVIIGMLRDMAINRVLASNCIARAQWNIDVDYPLTHGADFTIDLTNDEPYERSVRAYLIVDEPAIDDSPEAERNRRRRAQTPALPR